ncbi:uncharacterized protein BJ212DRAFT_1540454 [Suillus subaureus]|uniref:DUF6533 domain-containing protein n=1 Tax=Suillus subaureus TaxID=48587 RepID=A0A9P7JHH9_9AGAM|nr:uncharacterized protein BJ212DRAFT_1540454 [Suillus subaureus]KAG1822658.1 hypothetical protein BJ212DRAFT_1540454 [Suillus subaureus]
MKREPCLSVVRLCIHYTHYFRRQTIYVGIVGFTILIWDHIVTIADEIELIWRRPKGTLVYLFLLNRYLTPLVFIINLVGEYFTFDLYCRHFVRYEGATTAVGIEIVGLMMLLRVIAMYKNQWAAIAPAVFLLLAWIVVTAWLLSYGERMQYADVSSETLFSGSIASATAWLPLLYDTYVFGLTLKRTLPSIRNKEAGYVIRTVFADGLLYYSVICTINLILAIMIVRAQEGVKNIAAQYAYLHYRFHGQQVTMMSRITLNLKKQGFHGFNPHHSRAEDFIMSIRNHVISTPSGEVSLSRLRSHSVSSAARVESSSRARSGSVSSIVSPVRTITLPEDPLIFATRPRLSTVFSATSTPIALSPSGSPVSSEYVDWPSALNSDQRNTTDINIV